MRRLSVLTLLSLAGCSSGNESLPVYIDTGSPPQDAGRDVVNDFTIVDTSIDLRVPDTGQDVDVDTGNYYCVDANLPKVYVSSNISLVKSVNIPYSASDLDGGSPDQVIVIRDAISAGTLPYDPNGFYFFIPSADVSMPEFCFWYCGFHGSATIPQGLIRYAVIPDPTNCQAGCNPFQLDVADTMASTFAHELAEGATDPDPLSAPAWQDTIDQENSDKCAWQFGETYVGSHGFFNVGFGNRTWLIQQFWELDAGGAINQCALDLNGNPGFDVAEAGVGNPLDAGYSQNDGLPILYKGGKVMSQPIHLYYVWYGAWSGSYAANTKTVLELFGNSIGSSNWWQMVAQYYEEPGCFGDSGVPDGGDAGVPEASSD